jgi:hypothetical protein
MGRYYSGDIEGKFWFAVQSSTCADRFGSTGETRYLTYVFEKEQLWEIEEELKRIETRLGDNLKKMEEFFATRRCYDNEELAKYLGLDLDKTKFFLSEYADYLLGIKIRDCVKENDYCSFEAEL